MAAFTGTPVSAATHTVKNVGPRALPFGLLMEPFYWLHTATQGSGTGAVDLCLLPPGKWRIRKDYSFLDVTALATGATCALGVRATSTAAAALAALVAATAGYAQLSTASGSNKDLTWTAIERGPAGELISMTLTDPASEGALAIDVTGTDITVTLANSAVPAITSTAAQVKAALDADPAVAALITTVLKTGQTGVGVMAALTKTQLAPAALARTSFADLGLTEDYIVESDYGTGIVATIASGNIEAGDIIQGWIAYEREP